jgi:hypothetical protein
LWQNDLQGSLQQRYGNLVLVHGPVHASWLNQIEIYFSILQHKALVSNDFQSLEELEERLIGFQSYYEQIAQPFKWNFTRRDLNDLLHKINPPVAFPERLAA